MIFTTNNSVISATSQKIACIPLFHLKSGGKINEIVTNTEPLYVIQW